MRKEKKESEQSREQVILEIYKRNALGVFNRTIRPGGGGDSSKAWPLIFIVGAALLPVNLTISAGIKTLIDFFSRKPTPKEQFKSALQELNSLDQERMASLVKVIDNYSAKSNSSSELQVTLSTMTADSNKEKKVARQSAVNQFEEEKYKLQLEYLELKTGLPASEKVFLPEYVHKVAFDDASFKERFSELEKNLQVNLELIEQKFDGQLLENQKNKINNYLNAAHNRGKKMEQNICNFFSKKPDKENDNNTSKGYEP